MLSDQSDAIWVILPRSYTNVCFEGLFDKSLLFFRGLCPSSQLSVYIANTNQLQLSILTTSTRSQPRVGKKSREGSGNSDYSSTKSSTSRRSNR